MPRTLCMLASPNGSAERLKLLQNFMFCLCEQFQPVVSLVLIESQELVSIVSNVDHQRRARDGHPMLNRVAWSVGGQSSALWSIGSQPALSGFLKVVVTWKGAEWFGRQFFKTFSCFWLSANVVHLNSKVGIFSKCAIFSNILRFRFCLINKFQKVLYSQIIENRTSQIIW